MNQTCRRCSHRLFKSGDDWWCLYHGEQYLPVLSQADAVAEVERRKPPREESVNLLEVARRLGTRPEVVRRVAKRLGYEAERQTMYTPEQLRAIGRELFRNSGGTVSADSWAMRNRVPIRVVHMAMKHLGLRGRLKESDQELLYEALVDPGELRVWTAAEVANAYNVTILMLNTLARQRIGVHIKGKAGILTRAQILGIFGTWELG